MRRRNKNTANFHQPFNSQKWLTCNFSLWYSGIIQQTGHEKTQTYQVEVVTMAKLTNLKGNV